MAHIYGPLVTSVSHLFADVHGRRHGNRTRHQSDVAQGGETGDAKGDRGEFDGGDALGRGAEDSRGVTVGVSISRQKKPATLL